MTGRAWITGAALAAATGAWGQTGLTLGQSFGVPVDWGGGASAVPRRVNWMQSGTQTAVMWDERAFYLRGGNDLDVDGVTGGVAMPFNRHLITDAVAAGLGNQMFYFRRPDGLWAYRPAADTMALLEATAGPGLVASERGVVGLRNDGTLFRYDFTDLLPAPGGTFRKAVGNAGVFGGIEADGTLRAWRVIGGDEYEPLTDLPTGPFADVVFGREFGVGLRPDGTLTAWGTDTDIVNATPTGAFLQVAAGSHHAVGLRTDGTLVSWGIGRPATEPTPTGVFSTMATTDGYAFAIPAWTNITDAISRGTGLDRLVNRPIGVTRDFLVETLTEFTNGAVATVGRGTIVSGGGFTGVGTLNTHDLVLDVPTVIEDTTVRYRSGLGGVGDLDLRGTLQALGGGSAGYSGDVTVGSGGRLEVRGTGDFSAGSVIVADGGQASFLSGQTLRTTAASGTEVGGEMTIASVALVTPAFVNAGRLTVSGGDGETSDPFVNRGTLRVESGASFTAFGDFSGAGGVTGGGDLYLRGAVRPGESGTGTMTIGVKTVIGFVASTEIEIGGESAFDRLVVTGPLTVDGYLTVRGRDGYRPAFGTAFDVLTATSGIDGQFADLPDGATVGSVGGQEMRIRYEAGRIRLVAVPEPASMLALGAGLAFLRRRRR